MSTLLLFGDCSTIFWAISLLLFWVPDHLVNCRCGRFPPEVRTAIPVEGRFEHIVLSCNATSDHGIVWIEREAEKALQVCKKQPLTFSYSLLIFLSFVLNALFKNYWNSCSLFLHDHEISISSRVKENNKNNKIYNSVLWEAVWEFFFIGWCGTSTNQDSSNPTLGSKPWVHDQNCA